MGILIDSPEMLQAKRRIILSQPRKAHFKGSYGKVCFTEPTVKNARIYYQPIQYGSGTPSGNNKRGIGNWYSLSFKIGNITITTPESSTGLYGSGGYYDCDTGIATVILTSHTMKAANDSVTSYSNRGNSSIFWLYSSQINIYNTQNIIPLSNMFTWYGYNYSYDAAPDWSFAGSSAYPNSFWMKVPNSALSELSLNGAKQWTNDNPVQVVGMRKTSIARDFGPTTITASRGEQIIDCSVSTGTPHTIEFDYWTRNDQKYRFVDYLTTVGYQTKIDTGVPGNNSTLEIYGKADVLQFKQYQYLFGNRTGNDYSGWYFLQSSGSGATWLLFGCNDGNSTIGTSYSSIPWNDGFELEFVLRQNQVNCLMNGTASSQQSSGQGTLTISTENICLGAICVTKTDTDTTHVYNIRQFKIWSNSQLIRDYKPCVRLSDSKPGFYDTVNNTFNPSIGTADFIPGYD